eukprot:gene11617-4859_t
MNPQRSISLQDILANTSPDLQRVEQDISTIKIHESLSERRKKVRDLFATNGHNFDEYIASLSTKSNEGVYIMDKNGLLLYRCPLLGKFAKPEETDDKIILQTKAEEFFVKYPDSMFKEVYDMVFSQFPEFLEVKGHIPVGETPEVLVNFKVYTLYNNEKKPFAVTNIFILPEEFLAKFQKQKEIMRKLHVDAPTIRFNDQFQTNTESDWFSESESDKSPKRRKTIDSISPPSSPSFSSKSLSPTISSLNNLKFNLTTDLHIYEKSKRGLTKKEDKVNYSTGAWSPDEHDRFVQGYQKYGRNWSKIAKEFVKTRSRTQVTSYAQKFLNKN